MTTVGVECLQKTNLVDFNVRNEHSIATIGVRQLHLHCMSASDHVRTGSHLGRVVC